MLFLKNALALLSELTNPICAGCMSWYATDHGTAVVSYNVHVGLPFEQTLCDTLHNVLAANGPMLLSRYECWNDDNYITTHLNTLPKMDNGINFALNGTFPQIPGGFNCPSH